MTELSPTAIGTRCSPCSARRTRPVRHLLPAPRTRPPVTVTCRHNAGARVRVDGGSLERRAASSASPWHATVRPLAAVGLLLLLLLVRRRHKYTSSRMMPRARRQGSRRRECRSRRRRGRPAGGSHGAPRTPHFTRTRVHQLPPSPLYARAATLSSLHPPPSVAFVVRTSAAGSNGSSRQRAFCHSADVPSPSLLKHLLQEEGGAAE